MSYFYEPPVFMISPKYKPTIKLFDYSKTHLGDDDKIWGQNVTDLREENGLKMTSAVGVASPTTHYPTGPKRVGLLPLEFADCLLDSPYFRENLRAHEKQLDQTSADIKGIIKDIQVSFSVNLKLRR